MTDTGQQQGNTNVTQITKAGTARYFNFNSDADKQQSMLYA